MFSGGLRLDHDMAFINQPEIISGLVTMFRLDGFFMGVPVYSRRAVGYRMCPLSKTWYEEEVDTQTTKTIRFAKRSDGTGILFKIDKAEFYKLPGPPG